MLNPNSPFSEVSKAFGLLFAGFEVISLVISKGILLPITVVMFFLAFIILYTELNK